MFGVLRRNVGSKVFALFLAFLLWTLTSAQRRERTQDRTFDVPLAVVGTPRNFIITTELPDTVSVRLRGKVSQVRSVLSQDLEALIDLSGSDEGEFDVGLTPQSISAPGELEVVSVDPSKLTIRLERRSQRIVPIRPYPVGEVPAGYVVEEITTSPENALVSGPESVLRDVTEVVTERIVLSGRTAAFRMTVSLVSDNVLVGVETPSAQVTVVIVERSDEVDENGGSRETPLSRPRREMRE